MSYPHRPATLAEAVWFIGEVCRANSTATTCSSEVDPIGRAYVARMPHAYQPNIGEYVGRSYLSQEHALQSLAAVLWDNRVPIELRKP